MGSALWSQSGPSSWAEDTTASVRLKHLLMAPVLTPHGERQGTNYLSKGPTEVIRIRYGFINELGRSTVLFSPGEDSMQCHLLTPFVSSLFLVAPHSRFREEHTHPLQDPVQVSSQGNHADSSLVLFSKVTTTFAQICPKDMSCTRQTREVQMLPGVYSLLPKLRHELSWLCSLEVASVLNFSSDFAASPYPHGVN